MGAFTPMVPSKSTGTRPGSPERSGVPVSSPLLTLFSSRWGADHPLLKNEVYSFDIKKV